KAFFQPGVHLVSIKFQPDGFNRFTAIPGGQLRDDYAPLEEMRGLWTPELTERLAEAPDDAHRVRLLDAHLLRRLPNWSTRPDATQYALHLINSQRDTGSVDDLARTLRVSRRHLARLFEERVGVSPNFYARTVRFAHLSRHLWSTGPVDYQNLVHEFGFHDQSHFIREVRLFTGLNPSLAARNPRLHDFMLHA
ncbi:MAG: AraC family transcriptional regulator, partial [Ferruginibacter sp.]|nr:AraC family transcriptional regulator [Cytophagales bacterium]